MLLSPKDMGLRSRPAQHLFKDSLAGSCTLAKRWYLIVDLCFDQADEYA
jgi:hypothetical protein